MASPASALTPTERVIAALEQGGYGGRRNGKEFVARCPAHPDRSPSLNVTEAPNGSALVLCRAGCLTHDVLRALGLSWADAFPPKAPKVSEIEGGRRVKARYTYCDEDGEILFRVVRYDPKEFRQQAWDAAAGRWLTKLGDARRVLYRLPQVRRAVAEGRTVWVVEGEKDVENLDQAGVVATCNPAGADNGRGSKWTAEMTESLRGARKVVVCVDDDEAGHRHGRYVAGQLAGVVDRVVVVKPERGAKDITDHLKLGLGIDQVLKLDDTQAPTGWLRGPAEPIELGDHEEAAEAAPLDEFSGWVPEDMAAVLASLDDVERPGVLVRTDGLGVFYAGRLNGLMGESGFGKSWLALLAVVEEFAAGRPVLFLDWEDSPRSIARRLLALGVTTQQIVNLLVYVQPDTAFDPLAKAGIEELVAERGIRLAVIDSTGEALAAAGANPNSDDEVARWIVQLPRFLERRLGMTVLTVDHVPKDQENAPALYAIGSQRKRAAISGSLIKVVGLEPFARGKTGRMKLVVAKDRPGTFPQGTTVAEVTVESDEDGRSVRITIAPPAHRDEATGVVDRPTVLMERISRWLELNPGPHSGYALEKEVRGKAEPKRRALRVLVEEGFVAEEAGARGARLYRHVTTFRDNPQGIVLDGRAESASEGRPRPTSSHLVPTSSRDEVKRTPTTSSHLVPTTPYGGRDGDEVGGRDGRQDEPDIWTTSSPVAEPIPAADRVPSRIAVGDEDEIPW